MSQQLIDRFIQKCAALKDGRFLMSKDRISGILRLLASDDDMIELIKVCNRGFDYSIELHQCNSFVGGQKIFRMPAAPRKIVALVTGLLYDFDRKPRQFNLFLGDYFPAETPNAQFSLFFDEIVEPYKAAVVSLLKQEDDRPNFDDAEEKPRPLSEALKEQIFPLIESLTTEVLAASLGEIKCNECIDVLEGFYYALESADERLVKAMWLGAKNTVSPCKIGEAYIRQIDKVFNTYLG